MHSCIIYSKGATLMLKDPLTDEALEIFLQTGYRAIHLAIAHLTEQSERPVFEPMTPQERQTILQEPLSDDGKTAEELMNYVERHILSHSLKVGHPRFFGWTPPTPYPLGAIADFLAAIFNPNCIGGDHAATYLELTTLRWLMELVGFPCEGSMGLLVSGGSVATLTALCVARHHAAMQDGWNDREEGLSQSHAPLVLYLSEEAHLCFFKAAELLGLGLQAVRVIPTDAQFKMDMAALQFALQEDRQAGKRPFCIVGNAGTINTGAIDPLDAIADLCEEQGLWFHVDGSLGALSVLDPAVASQFAGMARADSLTLDAHKALSVPYECGCILVRDREKLHETFRSTAACLHVEEGTGLCSLWFSDYGIQLSRGFRALKLWMTLQSLGRRALQDRLAYYHHLARLFVQLIEKASDFELLAPVTLSVVCFRYLPLSLQGQEDSIERFNRKLVARIQEAGKILVSSTTLRGRFVLRICILHETTREEDIRFLVEAIREEALDLCSATLQNEFSVAG
jgi:aromatic-L-amino-acid decarboxylase